MDVMLEVIQLHVYYNDEYYLQTQQISFFNTQYRDGQLFGNRDIQTCYYEYIN